MIEMFAVVLTQYTGRNLIRRPWRSAMTVAGITGVVFAVVLMLMLARGLFTRVAATGEAANLVVISRTGQSIVLSALFDEDVALLVALQGIGRDAADRLLISPELVHLAFVEAAAPSGAVARAGAPLTVRGIRPIALEVHRSIEVTAGRMPLHANEVMVGSTAASKLGLPPGALVPGSVLQFEGFRWVVCGVFTAAGSLFESEVWLREADLMAALQRATHSCAVVRFVTPAAAQTALLAWAQPGPLANTFSAWLEPAYYRNYAQALSWILWLAWTFALAIGAAGALIGMNTMYTNVIARRREIATLRVLGFRRATIAVMLAAEAVALTLLAGIGGVVLGRVLDAMPLTLAQGAFLLQLDAVVVGVALGLALVIGLIGVAPPAFRVLHGNLLENTRA
jgi:putative ABC transport system permease protein